MSDSILEDIQIQMVDRLQADPYFSNLTVLHQKSKDIENEIARAIGKLGVCVVIVTPTASVSQTRDTSPPYFDRIDIVVRVSENVVINQATNGTHKSALAVAEHILALLHLYKPDAINEAFYAIEPSITIVDLPDGLLTYDVQLRTQGGIAYDVDQVATPVIAVNAGLCTITCATSHANIIYSVDGATMPTPRKANAGSPTAFFYSAPFAVAGGTKIRARGWLAGYLTSVMAQHTA